MKYIEAILLSSLALLAPAKAMLVTVLLLSLFDMLLGVAAAIRRKEPVTSRGLKRTILKLFVYEIAVVCAFLAQTYLIGPEIPAMNLVSGLIGLTELKSILENLDEINGEPLFQTILSKLESKDDPKPPLS